MASTNRERKTKTENRKQSNLRSAEQANKLLNQVLFYVLIKWPKTSEKNSGQKRYYFSEICTPCTTTKIIYGVTFKIMTPYDLKFIKVTHHVKIFS